MVVEEGRGMMTKYSDDCSRKVLWRLGALSLTFSYIRHIFTTPWSCHWSFHSRICFTKKSFPQALRLSVLPIFFFKEEIWRVDYVSFNTVLTLSKFNQKKSSITIISIWFCLLTLNVTFCSKKLRRFLESSKISCDPFDQQGPSYCFILIIYL